MIAGTHPTWVPTSPHPHNPISDHPSLIPHHSMHIPSRNKHLTLLPTCIPLLDPASLSGVSLQLQTSRVHAGWPAIVIQAWPVCCSIQSQLTTTRGRHLCRVGIVVHGFAQFSCNLVKRPFIDWDV